MSSYKQFDLSKTRRYSVKERRSKVGVGDFARPVARDSLTAFAESLPNILAARDLRELVDAILSARQKGKPIIWGFGGHLVKVGLAPVLIDLMDKGFVTALATNGSGSIHDFEVAYCGQTSEDVERELVTGSFGMSDETGVLMNKAICRGAEQGKGIGESIGSFLGTIPLEFPEQSLLLQAHQRKIPLTVHLAVGTDTIHAHPDCDGASLGKGSHIDFKVFTEQVSCLDQGGVYLNFGSAVILPEVFLKAVSAVRSAGLDLENFVTANFDFIQHYRPTQNVIRRPVSQSGRGFALTGHHEIMLPLLAGLLVSGGSGGR